MCGIVGYIGNQQAAPILLDGLSKLEYRGYDSSGIAVYNGNEIDMVKSKGRLKVLNELTHDGATLPGTLGIGHTRWATHGSPSDINAHPHFNKDKSIVVVHNGIIENYLKLKKKLENHGYEFVSETDTEVIAHLLDYYYHGNPLQAVTKIMHRMEGSYALGIIFQDHPGELYAVRKDSPLIVGHTDGGSILASDVPAVLKYTRDVFFIENEEIVRMREDSMEFFNVDEEPIEKQATRIEWDVNAAEKSGYEHFMLKEMYEQPKAITDTFSPRIKEGKIVIEELGMTDEEILKIQKIQIVACGSASHTGYTSKYIFEGLARIPVEVDVASEFRYRDPILDETTKAYSAQLIALYLLAMKFAHVKGMLDEAGLAGMLEDLKAIPAQVEMLLNNKVNIQKFANRYLAARDVFFIGRGIDHAISMEGSLKLNEISYIHSEAYAAGELKHGTISLVEDGTLVASVLTQKDLYKKMISNMEEVRTRGAFVMAVTTEGNTEVERAADYVIYIPETNKYFTNSLAIIPLQLFAYYIAVGRGCDVDKPRNLAKSVTVE